MAAESLQQAAPGRAGARIAGKMQPSRARRCGNPRSASPSSSHPEHRPTSAPTMPAIAFDRFYRYAELTDLLHAFAREHPDLVVASSRSARATRAATSGCVTVTNAQTGPADEKPAFWVDGNIHATEVAASAADLYFLHTLVTQYGKRPRRHARARHARVLRLPAHQSRRRRMGARRQAEVDPLEHAAVSARRGRRSKGSTVEDIDGDGRILQMRIADPNGVWKAHPDEPRLMIRREPDRDRRHVLPDRSRRHGRGLRRLHAARQEARAGTRPQSQFPGELAPGIRAARRRAVSRRPSPRCARSSTSSSRHPQHHRRHRVPHLERRAAASVRAPARRRDARRGPLGLPGARARKGTELTGYPAHLGLPRVPLSPEVGDRRHVRLGLRAPRHRSAGSSRSGRRCAKRASTNYKYIDWFRDHPPEDDLEAAALERRRSSAASRTSAGSRSTIRSSARSRSAAGIASTRSPIRRRQFLERELARFPKWLVWQALMSPKLELVHARRDARRRRQLDGPARRAEHGLAADVRVEARAGAQGRARRWSPRSSCPPVRRSFKASARDEHGQLEGTRVQAHRRLVLAGLPRHRRPR